MTRPKRKLLAWRCTEGYWLEGPYEIPIAQGTVLLLEEADFGKYFNFWERIPGLDQEIE